MRVVEEYPRSLGRLGDGVMRLDRLERMVSFLVHEHEGIKEGLPALSQRFLVKLFSYLVLWWIDDALLAEPRLFVCLVIQFG